MSRPVISIRRLGSGGVGWRRRRYRPQRCPANLPMLERFRILDLLPDNHPDITPDLLFLRSLRCAKLNRSPTEWRRSSIARCGNCCSPPDAQWSGRAWTRNLGKVRSRSGISAPCPLAFPAVTPPMRSCVRRAFPKRSEISIQPARLGKAGLLAALAMTVLNFPQIAIRPWAPHKQKQPGLSTRPSKTLKP